jgi:hypothetical protein
MLELQKELGAGGNAAVFTATTECGDEYAVKMLEMLTTIDLTESPILNHPDVLKALLGQGPRPAVCEAIHHLSCNDPVTSGVIPAIGVFFTTRTGREWWVGWKRAAAEAKCRGKKMRAALDAACPTVYYLCLVQQLGVTTLEQVYERLLNQPMPSVSTHSLLVRCAQLTDLTSRRTSLADVPCLCLW